MDRTPLDPIERAVVRAVMRLEQRRSHVGVAEVARAFRRTRFAGVDVSAVVRDMVLATKLFSDERERYDPRTGTSEPIEVIRVNARHPDVRSLLGTDV
jgi:hypothetical protein